MDPTNLKGTPGGVIAPGEQIPVLDGLRGIAILLVFLVHAITIPLERPTTTIDATVRALSTVGWTGVDLFFVLSGFLITGILLDTRGQRRWWLNFITRRALRIFPLYYGTLVILFVVLPRLAQSSAIPEFSTLQANQGWYWSYTVNLLLAFTHAEGTTLRTGHFWSLAVEEQFYLMWPLIVWMCKPRTLLRVVGLTVLGGVIFRLALVLHNPVTGSHLSFFLTPARLDGLMIGAALAVFARRPGGLASLKAAAPWVLAGCVLSITALAMFKGGLAYRDPVVMVAGLPLVALGFGTLLLLALTGPPTSRLVRALSNGSLRKWGRLSYGIYVIHFPLLGLLEWKTPLYDHGVAFLGGSRAPIVLLLAAVGMSLSYVIAWLSYHFYEKRFLELKRYFAHQPTPRTPPITPVPPVPRSGA